MSYAGSSKNEHVAHAALSERDREFTRRLAEALARRRKALQNSS